jgi:hypothetical protein
MKWSPFLIIRLSLSLFPVVAQPTAVNNLIRHKDGKLRLTLVLAIPAKHDAPPLACVLVGQDDRDPRSATSA